jgi:hypothetical protein
MMAKSSQDPQTALGEENSHHLPRLQFLKGKRALVLVNPSQRSQDSNPCGLHHDNPRTLGTAPWPRHPSVGDFMAQLWKKGPFPIRTSDRVPENQTTLSLPYFFPSSHKLENVNNQKRTHAWKHIFLNSLTVYCCSCQQKQVQLPGPVYVSTEAAAWPATQDTGLTCAC